MSRLLHRSLVALALIATTALVGVRAESLASSASSAGSASSASVSDSIGDSSDSSSRDRKVASGEYRVVAVAPSPGRPQTLRLSLEPVEPGPAQGFVLHLPERALAEQPLAVGDRVRASERPYGIEFARAATREAFFLVLHDDWARDMDSHVVAL
jgi:hypothetical protein